MTLRLVLVSMVAGLGISLPSWPILERWVDSSQKWMNARLAEWDDHQEDEQSYVVIHDLLKVEMERARTARLARSAAPRATSTPVAERSTAKAPGLAAVRLVSLEQSAFIVRNAVALLPLPVEAGAIALHHGAGTETQSIAAVAPVLTVPTSFEPLVVGDQLDVGTAHELNHANEGIGILPRVVVHPAAPPAPQPVDLLNVAVDRLGSAAVRSLQGLGNGLRTVAARELAVREAAARELAARESAASQFDSMGRSDNLYFADAPVAAAPEMVAEAAVELPGFEAMENSENLYFAESVAGAELESAPVAEAETKQPASVEPVATLDAIPDDPFAPAPPAVASDSQSSRPVGALASDLKVKTQAVPAEASDRTVQASRPRRPEVNRAMRLTRDALLAWASVLAQPSIVAVGPTTTSSR